jgi:hypothetical protein
MSIQPFVHNSAQTMGQISSDHGIFHPALLTVSEHFIYNDSQEVLGYVNFIHHNSF